jgi:hypothetical protein
MTETLRIDIRTCFTGFRPEWWIHSDANDIVSWRHNGLPITTVENKVLSSKCESVSVGPTRGDSLISGYTHSAATPEFSFTGWITTDRSRNRIRIQHAEATLRCAPNLTRARIN